MTLNGVIALILCFLQNSIAFQADYFTVVKDRPIMSVKYCLAVPVFHFWPKLTHPAAWSLCASQATYQFWRLTNGLHLNNAPRLPTALVITDSASTVSELCCDWHVVTARRPATCHCCCRQWQFRPCSSSVAWRSADYWAETRWNTCCVCHRQSEDTCSTTASQSVLVAERHTVLNSNRTETVWTSEFVSDSTPDSVCSSCPYIKLYRNLHSFSFFAFCYCY